jgi:glycoprotein endo-alpha-1,2-mannosidase
MKRALICLFFLSYGLVQSAVSQDRHVSVFYYPWYGPDMHWDGGYMRSELSTAQPPLLGHYSVRDPETIVQHINWSESYGIDNWICSWWGPESWEDETMREYIVPRLDTSHVSYCLFYESAGLLDLNDGIYFDAAKTETFRSHFKYLAENFFSDPSYYKIDGRPVVYIYLTRTFKGDYQNAIRLVRQDLLTLGWNVFLVGDEVYWGSPNTTRISTLDAITAYNMHGPHQYAGYPSQTSFIPDVAGKFSQYKLAAESRGVIFIPDILPGFNDRGTRLSTNHYIIPTRVHMDSSHTSTFSQSIDMAIPYIDNSLNAICITSFNEWHEDTQIEPTIVTEAVNVDMDGTTVYTDGFYYKGYGTDYLNLIWKKLSPAYPLSSADRKKPELSISPNPADEVLVIHMPNSGSYTIEIFSLEGKLLYSGIMDGYKKSISLMDIQKGIHLLLLRNDRYFAVRKFIKL